MSDGRQIDDLQRALTMTREEQAVAAAEYDLDSEALIGDCMRREGFEYTAFVAQAPPTPLAVSEDQYARTYGFGIATTIGARPPGLPDPETVDPNAAYRRTLDGVEGAAYDRAIEACIRWAGDQLPTPPGLVSFSGEIGRLYLETVERAQADPRVVEAEARWVSCMADLGHDFESREAMLGFVAERAQPFAESYDRATAAGGGELPDLSEVFTAEELGSLRRLQAEEVALAIDQLTCGEALDRVTAEVMREFLDAFIRDYWEHR